MVSDMLPWQLYKHNDVTITARFVSMMVDNTGVTVRKSV